MKIVTIINWGLLSIYGAFVLYAVFLKANPYNDAGGKEQELAIKGLAIFILVILIGLNLLNYQWTKVIALISMLLMLLLIRYIATH